MARLDQEFLLNLDARLSVWIDDVECGLKPIPETLYALRAEVRQLRALGARVTFGDDKPAIAIVPAPVRRAA